MKQIELKCLNCSKTFLRNVGEHKRNSSKNRRIFCSISCNASYRASSGELQPKNNPYPIKNHCDNHIDKYTGFREFIRRAKMRHTHEVSITLDELLEQWNKQDGKCVYTNIPMMLPKSSNNNRIFTASLDRIDSSKGYISGNIQFVIISINYMKNNMSHEETISLLDIINKYYTVVEDRRIRTSCNP